MKNITAVTAAIMVTVSLGGCSYKSSGAGLTKIGYEEKKLDDGSFTLTYYGSGFSEHEDVMKLWHKRAEELCKGKTYDVDTKENHWTSNSYTILPPLFFKSKAAAPSIEGTVRCKD